MRVSLSGHARKRMGERNVSREDIEHILAGRERSHPSPKKRTFRGRTLGGVSVEVVYTEARASEFHIITVKIL
jgi:hypothetical protein